MTKIQILDKGYIELQEVMGNDLSIVNAARVSYLGESKGPEQDKKLLFYLMEHHHTTPFEMVEFKFRVKCPLFVARQWMRHRTWSYNEISRRYTSDGIEFYQPAVWRKQADNNKQSSTGGVGVSDNVYVGGLLASYHKTSLDYYHEALKAGVAREQARFFLPQTMYTEFIAKVDAHNLLLFLRLRMHSHAQYEIRVYAEAIYSQMLKPALPWTAEAFEKFRLEG